MPGSEHLDKVHVGALGGEVQMVADRRPNSRDIGPLQVVGENHGMRHAGVDRVNGEIHAANFQIDRIAHIPRLAHGEQHRLTLDPRPDDSGLRLEAKGVPATRGAAGKPRKTTGPIAAHFGLPAVAVEIPHPEIDTRCGGGLQEQDTVRPDAPMPVAPARNGGGREVE